MKIIVDTNILISAALNGRTSQAALKYIIDDANCNSSDIPLLSLSEMKK